MSHRLPPARDPQWSDATREILAATTPAAEHPDGEGPPNILYTIAHHPHLLGPFLGFSSTLATRGVLTRRDSELLAVRASWNCRSAFEWGHHVEYALEAGMSHAEVERLAGPGDAEGWSDRDRWLVRAADELHADQTLSDDTYAALRAEFNEAQLVELVFIVGHYTMLSMVAKATGVELEARLPSLPGGESGSR